MRSVFKISPSDWMFTSENPMIFFSAVGWNCRKCSRRKYPTEKIDRKSRNSASGGRKKCRFYFEPKNCRIQKLLFEKKLYEKYYADKCFEPDIKHPIGRNLKRNQRCLFAWFYPLSATFPGHVRKFQADISSNKCGRHHQRASRLSDTIWTFGNSRKMLPPNDWTKTSHGKFGFWEGSFGRNHNQKYKNHKWRSAVRRIQAKPSFKMTPSDWSSNQIRF